MIAVITVVCDNPRHAGTVAKVSTFYVTDGAVSLRENGRDRRDRQHRKMKADPLHPESVKFWRDGVTEVPACNLCGRSLPDDPRVTAAVESIAAQHGPEHTISLSGIAAIIDRQ